MWKESRDKLQVKKSLQIYTAAVIMIFVILTGRIFWLQVIQEEIFVNKAENQSTRWITEEAPRGEVVDRNGNTLITNRPVYNLTLNYLGLQDQDISQVVEELVKVLKDPEITVEAVQTSIESQTSRLYEPIVIKRDIPIETVIQLEERRRELPGVLVETSTQRSYIHGTVLGHLLGYVHSIKDELEDPAYADYGIGDLVGKTGIEKQYEFELKGTNGYRQVTVDANNHPIQEVSSLPSTPGNKLQLTVDLDMQMVMEQSFDAMMASVQEKFPKAKAGAAVVLDVKTGGVLAMVSRPTVNPDDFNGKSMTQAQADYYFTQEPAAFTNRAIQGSYVPGSTFKPITGMAALTSGLIDPNEKINCSGRYWFKPYIKCTGVHGPLNYAQAMAKSCNVYFQEAARRAGIAQIGQIGEEFGLGGRTGIDLPFEGKGLLPSIAWQTIEYANRAKKINARIDEKLAEFEAEYRPKIDAASDEKEKKRLERELKSKINTWEAERKSQLSYYTTWHDFDTYNTGIGQGYNQYTIIQLAAYVAALANDGNYNTPFVVQTIYNPDGSVKSEHTPETRKVNVEEWILQATREAMTYVTKPGGTAYSVFKNIPESIGVGAKTGTAQPGRAGYEKMKDFDGLFIAFAPAEDPQIAFAGVMEFGNTGSGSVGMVARDVFEYYFGIAGNEDQPAETPAAAAAQPTVRQPASAESAAQDTGAPASNDQNNTGTTDNTGSEVPDPSGAEVAEVIQNENPDRPDGNP
jgi:penicillin-binding protein 2